MTFTTSLKEELSKKDIDYSVSRYELEGYLKSFGKFDKEITLTLENASVARKIYREIKMVFGISPIVTVRIQKRFRVKQIYLISVKDNVDKIKMMLDLDSYKTTMTEDEEKISFLEGSFLAIGNISNPQTSGYHLEYICSNITFARTIRDLLNYFHLNAKIVKRGYKHIVYIKSGECISDLLKMFKATSSMFFFEDIRIYRDHKNMVNRLNNCEVSNQTKSISAGLKQLEDIKYLKKNDLVELLDEKTKIVVEAREKYPESSLSELAEIISLEYNYKIGKSGINHHFIKLNKMVKRHQDNNPEAL